MPVRRAAAAGHAPPRPGPSARGVSVYPHRRPATTPDAPQLQGREVDRRFPAGKENFRQLKERANQAVAAAAEYESHGPPGPAAGLAFSTLDRNQSNNGGDNPARSGLSRRRRSFKKPFHAYPRQ